MVNTVVRPAHVVSLVRSGGICRTAGCVKEHANCGRGTGTRGGPLITLISVSEEPITSYDGKVTDRVVHRRMIPTAGRSSVHAGVYAGSWPIGVEYNDDDCYVTGKEVDRRTTWLLLHWRVRAAALVLL